MGIYTTSSLLVSAILLIRAYGERLVSASGWCDVVATLDAGLEALVTVLYLPWWLPTIACRHALEY